jgi:hypothetical protein
LLRIQSQRHVPAVRVSGLVRNSNSNSTGAVGVVVVGLPRITAVRAIV